MTRDTTPDELRELLEKATKGPWEVWEMGDPRVVAPEAGWTVYTNENPKPNDEPTLWANARLIVAAVNSLPALLDAQAEAERLRGERSQPRHVDDINDPVLRGLAMEDMVARLQAAQARADRLEGALRPFARIGELVERFEAQSGRPSTKEYAEHFKAAWRELSALSPTQREGN